MNRNFKIVFLLLLIVLQILLNRYVDVIKINIDLLFLVLIYISIKSTTLKTILAACIVGWVTDFFSGGIVGVFGFSRVLSIFLVHEFVRFIDLTKRHFLFLLISISLSFSNLIANVFFHYIAGHSFTFSFLLYQPLLTAFVGILIVSSPGIREKLDVY